MKLSRKTLTSLFIMLTSTFYSQNVGIGNTNPQNTLHVTPQAGNDPLRVDGVNQYTTERNLFIVDPATGVVKHMHIDSLATLIVPPTSVNTDDQNIDSVNLTGTTLTVYIENGTSANVDLSGLQDGIGTDDQNIDSLTLIGNILTVYIENGSSSNIDLSGLQDGTGTDDQNIDSLRLNGTILTTYIESGTSSTIDLQPLIDSAIANTPLDTLEWEKGSLHGDADTVIYARRAKDSGNNVRVYSNGDFDIDRHYMKDGEVVLTDEPNGLPISNSNFAVGKEALRSVNSGAVYNTAVGFESLENNTSGAANTSVGFRSLRSNTIGAGNTSVGTEALNLNTTGDGNTAVGYQAIQVNTTGEHNTSIGAYTLLLNTTGWGNTASGWAALSSNTTGFLNTSIGNQTLRNNTTGSGNIAIGGSALGSTIDGSNNLATGLRSMIENVSGDNNTAYGYFSLHSNVVGDNNVAIGSNAMFHNSYTSNNTVVGGNAFYTFLPDVANAISFNFTDVNVSSDAVYAPAHGLLIGQTYKYEFTTIGTAPGGLSNGSSYFGTAFHVDSILIDRNLTSQGTGTHTLTPSLTRDFENVTVLGALAEPTKSNQVTLGNTTVTEVRTFGSIVPGVDGVQDIGSATERWNNIYAINGTINTSDRRLKENISELNYGLTEVLKLNPVTYNWKKDNNGVRIGFIAQDLKEILPETVNTASNEEKTLGVRYTELIPVLTKAIQELSEENNQLKKRLVEIEKMLQQTKN